MNVTTICETLTRPLYNPCANVIQEERNYEFIAQVIAITIPAIFIIYKVGYFIARYIDIHCCSHEPGTIEAQNLPQKKRKFCKLSCVDNAVMSTAIAIILSIPATFLIISRIYLNNRICKQIVTKGESACEYFIEDLLNSLEPYLESLLNRIRPKP